MTQMAIVIDRHATAINFDLMLFKWNEDGFLAGQSVVYREWHGVRLGKNGEDVEDDFVSRACLWIVYLD